MDVPRTPLWWAVAASLALHGSLVAGFFRPAAPAPSLSSPVLRLHLVQTSPASIPAEETSRSVEVAAVRVPEPLESQLVGKTVEPTAAAMLPNSAPSSEEQAATPSSDTTNVKSPALPSAPDYKLQGLDPPPRTLEYVDPEYPASAGTVEGTVMLRLLISSTGTVDEVAVVKATPPGYFEASALKAAALAKYSPGYFLGVAVKSQLYIEIAYAPTNRGASVSGQGSK